MKVLFDHQIFQEQVTGGISKSFCEFIKYLPEFDTDWQLSIKQSNNLYLRSILPDNGFKPITRSYRDVKPVLNSNEIGAYLFTLLDKLRISRTAESINKDQSIRAIREQQYDVFHPTYFNPYFLKHLGRKPFVLTVHDLIPERFPKYYRSNDIQLVGRKILVNKADAIVAVSNNTKKDIIDFYNVPEEKITVIYHGAPVAKGIIPKKPLNDKPYFLFVGARNGYKNFEAFLQAFSGFSQQYPNVDIICLGHPFSLQEQKKIAELKLSGKVKSVLASEDDLEALYSSSLALVYPSYYEGFGMPILEAFAFHCPVLTYPASSLPEVGGKAAIYLNNDLSNFQDSLKYFYLLQPSERNHLIQLGLEHLQHFNWRKTAQDYTNVYHSII